MATEFHQRVQQILEASAQWAPDARDAAIHRACAGDSRLLQEVKSLLPHFDMVQDFEPERLLGTVVKFPGATTCAKAGIEYAQDEPTPFSIDQYKILQVLGEAPAACSGEARSPGSHRGARGRARSLRPWRREAAFRHC